MHCRQQERNAGMTLGQSPKLLTPNPGFTGDLGWAESLAWSAVQAWGGVGGRLWALRTGSRILQRTALNLWAWTLRPFSKWCCLPLVQ